MNIPITWMTFHAYGEEDDNRGKIMNDYVIDGDLAFSDMRSALKFYQEQYHKKKEWVGLTDDELHALHFELKVQTMGGINTLGMYRILEAKLKDKNNG